MSPKIMEFFHFTTCPGGRGVYEIKAILAPAELGKKYKKRYWVFSEVRSKFDFKVQPYGKFALVLGKVMLR